MGRCTRKDVLVSVWGASAHKPRLSVAGYLRSTNPVRFAGQGYCEQCGITPPLASLRQLCLPPYRGRLRLRLPDSLHFQSKPGRPLHVFTNSSEQ